MALYKDIKKDIITYIKSGDRDTANILKVLISDIQRDPNKDYSDDKVISCIKSTIKNLENSAVDEGYDIDIIGKYLPQQVEKMAIIDFLDSVDFTKLKNNMQAVGIAMKHFPQGTIDGKIVKELIQTMGYGRNNEKNT